MDAKPLLVVAILLLVKGTVSQPPNCTSGCSKVIDGWKWRLRNVGREPKGEERCVWVGVRAYRREYTLEEDRQFERSAWTSRDGGWNCVQLPRYGTDMITIRLLKPYRHACLGANIHGVCHTISKTGCNKKRKNVQIYLHGKQPISLNPILSDKHGLGIMMNVGIPSRVTDVVLGVRSPITGGVWDEMCVKTEKEAKYIDTSSIMKIGKSWEDSKYYKWKQPLSGANYAISMSSSGGGQCIGVSAVGKSRPAGCAFKALDGRNMRKTQRGSAGNEHVHW